MRTHGTLTKWNDERGFGFVSPAGGGADVFVHISAFHGGERPHLNEPISFETEAGPNGQPRAVRVMRAGQPAKLRQQARRTSARPPKRVGLVEAATLAAIVAMGAYGYSWLNGQRAASNAVPAAVAAPAPAVQFHCDGRKQCSQMRSCAEATQYLQYCPGTEMDGDGDGIPCEQQWCN